MDIRLLEKNANLIRQDIIEISFRAQGPSHPGPALSCADIITALYFEVMKIERGFYSADKPMYLSAKPNASKAQIRFFRK